MGRQITLLEMIEECEKKQQEENTQQIIQEENERI